MRTKHWNRQLSRWFRLKFDPYRGISIKGVIGNQRYYWDRTGLVRGIDGEINFNDLLTSLSNAKTHVILGGSFVSKYQKDDPGSLYKLPRMSAPGQPGGTSAMGNSVSAVNMPTKSMTLLS